MFSGKNIFISPLDWGLGHATRIVPLIDDLRKRNQVVIGVNPSNAFLFETLFPELPQIQMPTYNIAYSRFLPVWLKILFQSPKIISVIRKENKFLKSLAQKHSFDMIISDNRYGLHHKNIKSIIITHQLKIASPVLSGMANSVNRFFLQQFDEVWVPDYENAEARLAKGLSENKKLRVPVRYLGPQSLYLKKKIEVEKDIDYLIILSGPEPQRKLLEKVLIRKFEKSNNKVVLIRGKKGEHLANKNIRVLDFCMGTPYIELVCKSKTVICRSGYSTLMDLHALEVKNYILIPTPGQTEQEILARNWNEMYNARVLLQNEIMSSTF